MSDVTDRPTSGTGEEPGWTSSDTGTAGGAAAGAGGAADDGKGREWLSQLQSMIDDVATQAAPVLREIGAKAAELAAAAGEKAGPIAHRAAEVTESAGHKLAERGRAVADELRREEARSGGGGAAEGDAPHTIQPGAGAATGRPAPVSDTADTLGE